MPLQKLSGVAIFVSLQESGYLTRGTNSAESQAKIRLAFHFLERNDCAVFIWEYIKLVIIKDYESAFDAVKMFIQIP